MRRWLNVGLDVLLGVAWIALIVSFAGRQLDSITTADVVFVLWSPLVVGAISGRYRIALACAVLFVGGAVFEIFFATCDPNTTRCNDDIPVWFGAVYLAVAMALAAALMASGVWLRQRWTSITRGTRPTPG
jgi:hypothetical protein